MLKRFYKWFIKKNTISVWSYGANSIVKTASITVDQVLWWLHVLEIVVRYICLWIPSIPLPNIFPKVRDIDQPNVVYTLKEWYGDTHQWFHIIICDKICKYVYDHTETIWIDVEYDKLKNSFYEKDKEYWDELEIRNMPSQDVAVNTNWSYYDIGGWSK